jgi:DNA-binding NtrC family response regulator
VVCSNRAQAEEVLSRQSFELIFCDAHLSDGSYVELIHGTSRACPGSRIVVTVRERDSEFNTNAAARGAFAVVRWPGFATDIELTLLRAMRQQNQLAYSAVA